MQQFWRNFTLTSGIIHHKGESEKAQLHGQAEGEAGWASPRPSGPLVSAAPACWLAWSPCCKQSHLTVTLWFVLREGPAFFSISNTPCKTWGMQASSPSSIQTSLTEESPTGHPYQGRLPAVQSSLGRAEDRDRNTLNTAHGRAR